MPDARTLTIIAQDPSVRVRGRILTARVALPQEELGPGPRGSRAHVIDYDATTHTLYQPDLELNRDRFATATDRQLLSDPHFHAQNVFAIVMRTLARFERALGRRVGWGFPNHQIKIAPHAFRDANAFYSKQNEALLFGYFPSLRERQMVFSCLSHDVVAHETAHALLDGLRGRYTEPASPDQAAFHEGFADLVALLSVFSLPEVVQIAVDRRRLKESILLRMAKQLGREVHGRRSALRRPTEMRPSRKLLARPEYQDPHRRGEVLVAAVLRAFLDIWGKRAGRTASRLRIVEEGAAAADHLLTTLIRALDYCPPVDLRFSNFLSALLTADFENGGSSSPAFRDSLCNAFAAFGILPTSATGVWPSAKPLRPLLDRNPHEVFAFIWNHREALGLSEEALTTVESVNSCTRLNDSGFSVRETVAVYAQTLRVKAAELAWLSPAIVKPLAMDDDQPVTLTGGGTLIFDERGELKYDIRTAIRDANRQSERLSHLWNNGHFDEGLAKRP